MEIDGEMKGDVYKTLRMFYTYTPRRLADAPGGSRAVIRYEDFAGAPAGAGAAPSKARRRAQ